MIDRNPGKRAPRGIGLLDGSAIGLCGIVALYGLSQYLDLRSPHLTPRGLALGLVFFAGCAGLITAHGLRTSATRPGPHPMSQVLLLSLGVVFALYVVSSVHYLPLGSTAGTLVGALSGVYLFSGLRASPSPRATSLLAALFLGASVFFVVRDVCFDTLTMGSGTLEPRIRRGAKVSIDKLAFGLRVPFWSQYLVSWGGPERGDLVVFALEDGRLFIKEVLRVDGDRTEVKDIGVVERNRLRGRAASLPG